MPLYVLAIGDGETLSINAHSDEGAEILARSCLVDDVSVSASVLLKSEDGGRIIIDSAVGDMLMSA